MDEFNLGTRPVAIADRGDHRVVEISSCARSPGVGVEAIEAIIRQPLPDDFRDFYASYSEAVIVTRSRPLHLWPVSKIVSALELNAWAFEDDDVRHFFRFGEYLHADASHFALGQSPSDYKSWPVWFTSIEETDKECEVNLMSASNPYSLGRSFREWLKEFIASDGMNDYFLSEHAESPGGAAYDPVPSDELT